ncbi:hypothetical protein Pcinc_007379 [Petrolisthes cinctipes]|uniref:Gag-like protein n=1 Tax=Petrolisthes cinctipes TaxID=88211 RepID=A0AAE1KXI9_PETCI|nr:hypothetical protein Pcinc_007379 [Petrolisthes cinctipes]
MWMEEGGRVGEGGRGCLGSNVGRVGEGEYLVGRRCFRCQTWGHDKAACAAPGPRCGVCSRPHRTEGCLASLKNGERLKACCPNCRLGHHDLNLGCPARPTAGGDPSCSQNGLQAVLLEFSEGFAELLGVSVRYDKLYALVKRACSKLAAPQLTPRPVLLREKALPDTPPLPRRQEVQEAPCGVPPKRRRRRSGRKKATTTTTSSTQNASHVTCCVWTRAAPRGCKVGTQAAAPRTAVWRHRRPSHQHRRRCHHHHLLLGVNPHLPAATKRHSLTERRPRTWTWTRPSSSSPKRRKRRGARLLQQGRCWTHTLLLAA